MDEFLRPENKSQISLIFGVFLQILTCYQLLLTFTYLSKLTMLNICHFKTLFLRINCFFLTCLLNIDQVFVILSVKATGYLSHQANLMNLFWGQSLHYFHLVKMRIVNNLYCSDVYVPKCIYFMYCQINGNNITI